jgi:hypothetical protein
MLFDILILLYVKQEGAPVPRHSGTSFTSAGEQQLNAIGREECTLYGCFIYSHTWRSDSGLNAGKP